MVQKGRVKVFEKESIIKDAAIRNLEPSALNDSLLSSVKLIKEPYNYKLDHKVNAKDVIEDLIIHDIDVND